MAIQTILYPLLSFVLTNDHSDYDGDSKIKFDNHNHDDDDDHVWL